ncbi:MAG: hypothetical protein QOD44_2932, partial [Solirubrobacteraceae bacterium]|nr:hypothetical protein [Solirubrobacteraceae bacterium]
ALRSNLGATRVVLDAAALEELDGLAETPEDYWSARSQLRWT